MAYILDEVWVNNGQLIVAEAGEVPTALGDGVGKVKHSAYICLLYTSPSPRDISGSRMPSSA